MDSEVKKKIKSKYKSDFNWMRKWVNRYDLCGLIEIGAPKDEYDCLTSKLLNAFYNNMSRSQTRELILHEIKNHFGSPDLTKLEEPYISDFYRNLEELLDQIIGKV